ncbi:CPBP family intramembrane glutamic endopeptidase [Streptococcus equinus]|uniref:CAAX protease self-immunity n=1 Tax=Streptococcus equinus TaxID=1335 RepID=A0AAE8HJN3_STREI|nr:type II CAAX endopeptidase family protein [Streptococcus equinus]SDW31385.1 CAAX protease self-immunity [Streptococcus equinus]SEP59412.1 CAAX protease self-immunity [Streptococcus equinus]
MTHKLPRLKVLILTLLMAFMELSALPAAFLGQVTFKDIKPMYFTLMFNFVIALLICWLCQKFWIKSLKFGLQKSGLFSDLQRFGLPAVIATLAVAITFCIGLTPFDNQPSFWRVLVEGIIYYIGVAVVEEVYLRGLLQNLLEDCFENSQNAVLYAILITSFLFGFGHVFGALGQPLGTVICKTVWAMALGVYLGSVYVKTRNLWVPIVLHFVIDLCGIPFCFSTSNQYPQIALVTSLVAFVLLGVYGLLLLKNKD